MKRSNSKKKSLFNEVVFAFLIAASFYLVFIFLTHRHTHRNVPDEFSKDLFILVCWLKHWPKRILLETGQIQRLPKIPFQLPATST